MSHLAKSQCLLDVMDTTGTPFHSPHGQRQAMPGTATLLQNKQPSGSLMEHQRLGLHFQDILQQRGSVR